MIARAATASVAGGNDRQALHEMFERRMAAGDAYFSGNAKAIAYCAAAMADRFFEGGTLFILGSGAHASDAQHNSVEFVHPVLPGCRALPALSLTNDISTVTGILTEENPSDVYAHQLRALARTGDMVLAFAGAPPLPETVRAMETARGLGLLTVVLGGADTGASLAADTLLAVDDADPLVAQELHLATYHMLWELVHIVLNHRGIAEATEGPS